MLRQIFDLSHPLCALANLYLVILFARAIASWFPISQGSALIPVVRFLNAVTEPVLAPLRRVIPPAGMFDLSFLVVILVWEFVVIRVACSF